MEEIKEHPFLGRGLIADTRFKDSDLGLHGDKPFSDLNSWTAYMLRLGLIGFFGKIMINHFFTIFFENSLESNWSSF